MEQMKIAFLFPGQGSQSVGMGKGIYSKYEIAKQRFVEAEEILSKPLRKICFEGPLDKLTQTINTQPSLFVVSAIIHDILVENGFRPDAVAGHSLGEFTALYSSGVFSFEDGLKIVKKRAECMQMAGKENPGTMAAILGLPIKKVDSLLDDANQHGIVTIANYNTSMQCVISGEIKAVHTGMEFCRMAGARRAIELAVGGAFHSLLMEPAHAEFDEYLSKFNFEKPKIDFYANVTGKKETNPKRIQKLLAKQLLSPVLWFQLLNKMSSDGINQFCEVGVGKVLQGLARQALPGADKIFGFSNADDLNNGAFHE